MVVVVYNFILVVCDGYWIGVFWSGYYYECFNSDLELYGGFNVGNYFGWYVEEILYYGWFYFVFFLFLLLGSVILWF